MSFINDIESRRVNNIASAAGAGLVSIYITGVSIYGFYGQLMTSRNIEIVLSNPIAAQLCYLGYRAMPNGLKAVGNDQDNRLQCFLLIILM